MNRFNDWLAATVTDAVGSMWCVYAFVALTLVSLPAAIHSRDPIIIVSWVAQTFLQLVLIPIMIVGQKVIADRHDEHAQKLDEIHAKVHEPSTTDAQQG